MASGERSGLRFILAFLFTVLIHGFGSRDSSSVRCCTLEMADKCLLSVEPTGEEEGKESMTPKDFLG